MTTHVTVGKSRAHLNRRGGAIPVAPPAENIRATDTGDTRVTSDGQSRGVT